MNNGHDYHPSTGEFTCDVAGMYLFTLSANVSPGHEMLFCMKYNGHHWRYMAASGSGSHHQTASVSALYRMKHGDIMTVELTRNTDNTMATTTFEGVLLY
ncbi:Multimerin-2 [Mizuhopecten yessoensis]|uniref:Multimerin-2 n=2 Tax=Mizuhopecten yessoensis TaxID=6573 RepID=A0A210PDF2_MIZYE|nr:Multimerin-2 [Mizuhopecten yessoensis]